MRDRSYIAAHGIVLVVVDLPAPRRTAASAYGVSGAETLLQAGERKLVGGQEDQLIGIAVKVAEVAGQ